MPRLSYTHVHACAASKETIQSSRTIALESQREHLIISADQVVRGTCHSSRKALAMQPATAPDLLGIQVS